MRRGGDNSVELNAKYQLYVNKPHEFIFSVGWRRGFGEGRGRASVGRDSFTTFTPTAYLGKGMGDLPKEMEWVRPVAAGTCDAGGEFSDERAGGEYAGVGGCRVGSISIRICDQARGGCAGYRARRLRT